jgi:acylphosphatase
MTCRYVIGGMVQGVGFRWFTLRTARRIGVRGWVRNLPGGEVEVRATGTADQLAMLEEALERGPAGAMVTGVERSEVPDEPDGAASFEVK